MHLQSVILACMMMVITGCTRNHSSIESAVRANDAHSVRKFIEGGSDFRRGDDGSDLVTNAKGTCTLDSAEGAGTRVVFKVPVLAAIPKP